MRGLNVMFLSLLLSIVFVNHMSAQSPAKQLFLLEDMEHHQWCAYGTESEWASAVKSLGALVVATAEYSTVHISRIAVTEEDEAGDWVVYDHYVIDEKGQIREVERTINILPGDLSEDEKYAIVDGRAKKESSKSRRLSTKEVLPSDKEKVWLPSVPIMTRVQDFPFASLILEKNTTTSSGGKVCIPAKH